MEEVVGAFQRQVFQADNEVTQVEVLSEEWKERASKELGEVEEQVEKQLKELAASLPPDWPLPRWKLFRIEIACIELKLLAASLPPDWPLPRDDQFLLAFLRANSFNQAASLSMLSKYLRIRKERPQYFATSHPDLARFQRFSISYPDS